MPLPTPVDERVIFKCCAVHYLCQWQYLDREFVERFSREEVSANSLARLFVAYQVIRNFRGSNPKRFERLAAQLNRFRGRKVECADVPAIVEEVAKLMRRRARGKGSCTSAASKVCWMLMRHPIAIYDNRARIGLERTGMLKRKRGNEYADYFQAWQRYQGSVSALLSETVSWLPTVGVDKASSSEFLPTRNAVRQLVNQPWFADRIVDMRLFLKGSKNNEDEPDRDWMPSLVLAAKLG